MGFRIDTHISSGISQNQINYLKAINAIDENLKQTGGILFQ
jgi:hypothetical protein